METLEIRDFQKIKDLVDGQILFLYVCDYWNTELIKQLVNYGIKTHGICACYPKEGIHEPTEATYIQPSEVLKYPNSFVLATSEFANENISYLTENGFPLEQVIAYPYGKNGSLSSEISPSSVENRKSNFPPLPESLNSEFPPLSDGNFESKPSSTLEKFDKFKVIQEHHSHEIRNGQSENYQSPQISRNLKMSNKTKFNFFGFLNKYSIVLLIIILVVQLITMIYFVGQRVSWHVDEMLTLQQSSGRLYGGLIYEQSNFFNTWISAQEMMTFHSVSYEYRFNFSSVSQSLARDVHPPFHNLQLHLIGSLFPNQWNVWMFAIVNMFWMLGTTIMLYLSSGLLFKGTKHSKLIALLPPLLWSFSYAVINYTVFFRMYTTQIFFTTALVYLGLRILDDVKQNQKTILRVYIALFIILVLGWFTIHLFALFAALVGLFLLAFLLIKKEYNRAIRFTATGVAAIATFLLIWPATIWQIFGSFRGVGTMGLSLVDYLVRLQDYFHIINQHLFGGILVPILILLVIIIIFMIFISKDTLKINYQVVFLLFITLCSLLIIVQMAPSDIWIGEHGRYMVGIYPLFLLLFIWVLYYISNNNAKTKIMWSITMVLCVLVIVLNVNSRSNVMYLHQWEVDINEVFEAYENPNLVAIAVEMNYFINIATYFLDFANNFDNIHIMTGPLLGGFNNLRLYQFYHLESLFIASYAYQNQEIVLDILEYMRSNIGDFDLELYTTLRRFSERLNIYRVILKN